MNDDVRGHSTVPDPSNGWSRFERVIVYRLDELRDGVSDLKKEVRNIREDEIGEIKIDIAMLKVKAGLWGAAFGTIPAAIAVIFVLVVR
jgi:hypothetical protein